MAMSTDVAEFLGAAIGLNLLFGVPLLPAGLIYLVIANLSAVTVHCLESREDSVLLKAAFQSLHENARRLPRGSLVVLENPPERYYGSGLGVMEMVRLGLEDETAVGIAHGQPLSPRWARRLGSIRSVYRLDFAQRSLSLRRVPANPQTVTRHCQPSEGREARAVAPFPSPAAGPNPRG